MQSTCLTFVTLVFAILRITRAFHFAAGTACTGSGVCSYEYFLEATSSVVTVNGFCAPSGICAANGATCTADEQCFNYCGFTSGVCGGVGAPCNSQDVFDPEGQIAITCNTPFCSEQDQQGTCVLPASSGSRSRARAKARALQLRSNSNRPMHATFSRRMLANNPTEKSK